MRLFKLAPLTWCVLGLITVGDGAGAAVRARQSAWRSPRSSSRVIECGMIIGAVAVDRGAPLQVRIAFAAFVARAGGDRRDRRLRRC